jgi:hypothetical protein
VDAHVRGLFGLRVLARRLAELLGALRHVEHVIDDLEGKAHGRGVAAQSGHRVLVSASNRGGPSYARGEKSPRLGPVQPFQGGGRDALAFGLEVLDLAADETGCPRGLAQDRKGLNATGHFHHRVVRRHLRQEVEGAR